MLRHDTTRQEYCDGGSLRAAFKHGTLASATGSKDGSTAGMPIRLVRGRVPGWSKLFVYLA